MKALSQKNKKRNRDFKLNFENNDQLSKRMKSDGETILSLKPSDEQRIEGENMISKSKEIFELNASEKEKFLSHYNSVGHKQYQQKIGLR